MTRKISYTVVGASGEAEGFSAKNLEKCGPAMAGWQSAKYCMYPQELVLYLNQLCKIKTFQILSHQYMISSKIEFYTSINNSSGNFKKLGELKSVHVDVEALYLKLVIFENYLNKLNTFNQVGLIAFNVLGIPVVNQQKSSKLIEDAPSSKTTIDIPLQSDNVSPLDDLDMEMFLVVKMIQDLQQRNNIFVQNNADPDVTKILWKLNEKKKKAAKEKGRRLIHKETVKQLPRTTSGYAKILFSEDQFDTAKKTKQVIVDLQQIAEKLARFELDKQKAIDDEDFDLAKNKKVEIDDIRLKIHQYLEKHNLLEALNLSAHPSKRRGISPLQEIRSPSRREKRSSMDDHISIHPAPSSHLESNHTQASSSSRSSLEKKRSSPMKSIASEVETDELQKQHTSDEKIKEASLNQLASSHEQASSSRKSLEENHSSPSKSTESHPDGLQEEHSAHDKIKAASSHDILEESLSSRSKFAINSNLSKSHIESRSSSHRLLSDKAENPISRLTEKIIPEGKDPGIHCSKNKNRHPIEDPENRPSESKPYDEKVIPTHDRCRQQDPVWTSLETAEVDEGEVEPEPLTDEHLRDGKFAIEVFGLPLVTSAYSKNWSCREKAFASLFEVLSALPESTSKDYMRRQLQDAAILIIKGLKDNVLAVNMAALRLLEMILVNFIPRHKLGRVDVTNVVAQILPTLIQKTGDAGAPRVRASAVDYIVHMSSFPAIVGTGFAFSRFLFAPISRDAAHRLALSRVEIVHCLFHKHGVQEPAYGVDPFMEFCLSALDHASGPVREVACKIILDLYRTVGRPILAYLPLEFDPARKHPLYRNLFDRFDEIDGVPHERGRNRLYYLPKLQPSEAIRKQENISAESNRRKQNLINNRIPSQLVQKRPSDLSTPLNDQRGFKNPKSNRNQFIDDRSKLSKLDQEKTCIFCGLHDNSFNQDGLDRHYWEHCPMLMRCRHCKQAVEISGYNVHLLSECTFKSDYKKCPRCKEAILKQEFERHINDCGTLLSTNEGRCPLCREKILPSDDVTWQAHLMGSSERACRENPRRPQVVVKQNGMT